jgi:hypothetical protein
MENRMPGKIYSQRVMAPTRITSQEQSMARGPAIFFREDITRNNMARDVSASASAALNFILTCPGRSTRRNGLCSNHPTITAIPMHKAVITAASDNLVYSFPVV